MPASVWSNADLTARMSEGTSSPLQPMSRNDAQATTAAAGGRVGRDRGTRGSYSPGPTGEASLTMLHATAASHPDGRAVGQLEAGRVTWVLWPLTPRDDHG